LATPFDNDACSTTRPATRPCRAQPSPPLPCWTPSDAITFLRQCTAIDDPLTDLFELLIGTGLRKGEALALHWADVHIDQQVLLGRYTLSNVRNTTPVMTAPKTRASQAWVGLSDRVIAALERQARRRQRSASPAVSCSANPTENRYDLRRSCTTSTDSAQPPASRGSASTTFGISPRL
jgi:integrase